MKYDQLRKADSGAKKLSTAQKQEHKQEKYLEATAAIIQPIVDSVRLLHPMKVWEDISPQFMVTFWSLSIYDLEVPNESYQREIAKLKRQAAAAMDTREGVSDRIGSMLYLSALTLVRSLKYFHVKMPLIRNAFCVCCLN